MPPRSIRYLAASAVLLGAPAACRTWTPATRTPYYVDADVQVRFTTPRTVAGSARGDSLALRDVMRIDGTVADRRGDTIWVWVSQALAPGGERVSVPAGARARLVRDAGTIIDVGRGDPAKAIGFGLLALTGLLLLWWTLAGSGRT
jgi:hypothetical protein